MNAGPEYLVQKSRMSFLTATVLGISGVLITAIFCGTGIVCYGMVVLNQRTGSLMGLGQAALKGLPELQKSLPPALADAMDDARTPDYAGKLEVTGRLVPDNGEEGAYRIVMEVKNHGDKVVSMLPLHVALMDSNGAPLMEWVEYAATPLAGCDEWRGPLMPGATRQIRTSRRSKKSDRTVACEISDVRLWNPREAAKIETQTSSRTESGGAGNL
jgi:hypothetical protein